MSGHDSSKSNTTNSPQSQLTKQLKDTVFLPKTKFPMKGDMAKKDLEILETWKQKNLYKAIREKSNGRQKYILHYGPPYANGQIHIGHALSGVLKDAFNKAHQMLGCDAPMVIGFDCHGLPIEWKIEETYLKEGKKRAEVPVDEFMKRCRNFADENIKLQIEGFSRLGMVCDFENHYRTMAPKSEAAILATFYKILKKDLIYRGKKPVMWSVIEKTALAEAELEYKNKISDAIFVKYQVAKTTNDQLKDAYAVIWTTTPWTIPVSMAICYSDKIEYVLVGVPSHGKLIIAKDLLDQFKLDAKIDDQLNIICTVSHEDLAQLECRHPLYSDGFADRVIKLFQGDHVTADAGTGLVHTAPAHGVEDFEVGKKHGLEVLCGVEDDGIMSKCTMQFAGEHVYKVNDKVIDALSLAGTLVAHYKIEHSYPHSWRSKSPLIFRTTDQWFLSIDKIRSTLLEEVGKTQWFPGNYVNRIKGMIEKRPDWCISRQRVWGVPIALFIHKETNEILQDDKLFDKIIATIEAEGIESWRTHDASYFLADLGYDPAQYRQVMDTIEVWFDSGASHNYVLEGRPDQSWPADLYLEGSDQHRGWFQSSLVVACCTNGSAPYRQVATHGFVLDKEGRKMSKSIGNTVSPHDVMEKRGADVLRLWVLNSDYAEDTRIGDEILDGQQDVYRRFRNTLRYLLGVLSGYDGSDVVYDDLPELERLMLHQLHELDGVMRESIAQYNYKTFITALHNFCTNDLSSFYFDIRKDCIYCDGASSSKRKACLYVMNQLFLCLVHWLAPVISFTAEEAWKEYCALGILGDACGDDCWSIHMRDFVTVDCEWFNAGLYDKWSLIRDIRSTMYSVIEKVRADKIIGSSLEAEIRYYTCQDHIRSLVETHEFLDVAMVSRIVFDESVKSDELVCKDLHVKCRCVKSDAMKCDRCWKCLDDVTTVDVSDYGDVKLCERCRGTVEG